MAAKESELNKLHEFLARILKTQLELTGVVYNKEGEPISVYNKAGKEIDLSLAQPALIAQVIKFLKDNSITSVPEKDDNINQLKELLDKKPQKGRLQLVDPSKAAGETT